MNHYDPEIARFADDGNPNCFELDESPKHGASASSRESRWSNVFARLATWFGEVLAAAIASAAAVARERFLSR